MRTWQRVRDEIIRTKTGANQERWKASAKSRPFDPPRSWLPIEPQLEHLLHVLPAGTVTTNVYLRRMHNFALDMNRLPASIIPKREWPPVGYKQKRASTLDEHRKIVERAENRTTRSF